VFINEMRVLKTGNPHLRQLSQDRQKIFLKTNGFTSHFNDKRLGINLDSF
jgi:hypothetical protein